MLYKSPSEVVPAFTNERLTKIAKTLLEQALATDQDLTSPFDSGYTVGCTRFGRQRLSMLALAKENAQWLKIVDGSNRLILSIFGAPFRITCDDHTNPQKPAGKGITQPEAQLLGELYDQMSFAFPEEKPTTSLKWRFFTEYTENIEDGQGEYDVLFVGLDEYNKTQCVWRLSENAVSTITSTTEKPEAAVKKQPARTSLPRAKEKLRENSDE